jgi:hypothetical protein
MKLSEAINKDLETARVHWMYADRATVKIWNSMKPINDPPIFCGWYWMHGSTEGGPFRCESACMRDAWYRAVKKIQPPSLFHAGGTMLHRTLPTSQLKHRDNVVQLRS